MQTLLFIDATIRSEEESRTWQLCQVYLETWKEQNPDGTIEHLRLRDKDLRPCYRRCRCGADYDRGGNENPWSGMWVRIDGTVYMEQRCIRNKGETN